MLKLKKPCSECKKSKKLNEFTITERKASGAIKYASMCKECKNSYARRFRADNNTEDRRAHRNKLAREWDRINGYSSRKRKKDKNKPYAKKLRKLRLLRQKESVKELTDKYIINSLKIAYQNLSREKIINNKELMELKKSEILLYRLKKKIKNKKDGTK